MAERICKKCGQPRAETGRCKNCARIRDKVYYHKNRNRCKAAMAVYDDSWAGAMSHCIRGARRRGRRYGGIIVEKSHILALWEQQNGLCVLSGLPMDTKRASLKRVSLDRIDNTKGYSLGNVQLVCKFANLGKGAMTNQEFKTILRETIDGK